MAVCVSLLYGKHYKCITPLRLIRVCVVCSNRRQCGSPASHLQADHVRAVLGLAAAASADRRLQVRHSDARPSFRGPGRRTHRVRGPRRGPATQETPPPRDDRQCGQISDETRFQLRHTPSAIVRNQESVGRLRPGRAGVSSKPERGARRS